MDREIERLKEARALLAGTSGTRNATKASLNGAGGKRTMSPAGRRKIAEAMKKRWAERRRAAAAAGKSSK
nr:hypothetical protein [Paracidobacterium acidisoli]